MTFEEMIDKLLDNNIEITLKKFGGVVWYDLNTGMKSHLEITKSINGFGDEIAKSQGRYGHKNCIATWNDLMLEAKHCLHGNSYMNRSWSALLLKEGYLKATTTTNTIYE